MNKHNEPMTKEEFVESFRTVLAKMVKRSVVTVEGDGLKVMRDGNWLATGWPVRCEDNPCRDRDCHGWKLRTATPREVKKRK